MFVYVCFSPSAHDFCLFISSFFGKATKSDRIYVNAPDMQKERNEDIQLLSFNSQKASETGEENKGLDTEEKQDETDSTEEKLTPGDLMAFAWQISQGMVSRSQYNSQRLFRRRCNWNFIMNCPFVGQRVSFTRHIAISVANHFQCLGRYFFFCQIILEILVSFFTC